MFGDVFQVPSESCGRKYGVWIRFKKIMGDYKEMAFWESEFRQKRILGICGVGVQKAQTE